MKKFVREKFKSKSILIFVTLFFFVSTLCFGTESDFQNMRKTINLPIAFKFPKIRLRTILPNQMRDQKKSSKEKKNKKKGKQSKSKEKHKKRKKK